MIIVIACASRAIHKYTDGDFKLHWEFGRRFLAGEFLYTGGHHIPYPPFWAMAHAPAALLPMPIAKAVLFPLGVAAIVLLLRILRRLSAAEFRLESPRDFWVAALALFLASRFVIRDLAELGVNTALVALTWLAIYLWTRRQELFAGVSLGFAIALKCTPAIFVGYFLWKRQWRMVAISAAAAGLFTLAPIVWQGSSLYSRHIITWSQNASRGFANDDPSVGVLGPEPLQNMALRPTLARYLMHLPAGHLGRANHPLYRHFFDMAPTAAARVIKGILLVLLLAFLRWSCGSISARDDPRLLWECAALSILMLLFSPITWGQHCVAVIPACYFISAVFVARGTLPLWMMALLAFYVLVVLVLSRDLLGRDLSLLLDSYHLQTFALLGLLAVLFGCRGLAPHERR